MLLILENMEKAAIQLLQLWGPLGLKRQKKGCGNMDLRERLLWERGSGLRYQRVSHSTLTSFSSCQDQDVFDLFGLGYLAIQSKVIKRPFGVWLIWSGPWVSRFSCMINVCLVKHVLSQPRLFLMTGLFLRTIFDLYTVVLRTLRFIRVALAFIHYCDINRERSSPSTLSRTSGLYTTTLSSHQGWLIVWGSRLTYQGWLFVLGSRIN